MQDCKQSQASTQVQAMLPLAIAVVWHCVLEERVLRAMTSVDMLKPSQRLPAEERAPLICCAQVTIIAGHVAVAAKAICGSWVRVPIKCLITLSNMYGDSLSRLNALASMITSFAQDLLAMLTCNGLCGTPKSIN